MAALARRDAIVVASVSCIFDIGSPQVCRDLALTLAVGEAADADNIATRLVSIGYRPADTTLAPKTFRVRGPHIEVFTLYEDWAYRIEIQNGQVERILAIDPQSGDTIQAARQHYDLPRACASAARRLDRGGHVWRSKRSLTGGCKSCKAKANRWRPNAWRRRPCATLTICAVRAHAPGMEVYCRALNRRLPGAPPDHADGLFPRGLPGVSRRIAM